MTDVSRAIRARLAALDPELVELADESALHAGHEGAKGGGGHFRLSIVSPRFRGQSTVARHRLVYDALGPMMRREIHALAIRAFTPEEQSAAQPISRRKESA
jgi:BolA protein